MAPWFNYFQMTKQLEECDKLLKEKAKHIIHYKGYKKFDLEELWNRTKCKSESLNERKEAFGKIIELLRISCIYNLPKTRAKTESFIGISINYFLETRDLYDIQAITTLVELALPLEKEDIHNINRLNEKPVFYFDEELECRGELQKLSLDEINNNKGMLVWIISSHMERRANKLLSEENESLKRREVERAAQEAIQMIIANR